MLTQFVPAVNPRAEIAARKAERARVSAQKVISWYRDPANQPAAPRVAIQYNNAKIRDTDSTAFLIFSLPAVMTCPGANTGCLSALKDTTGADYVCDCAGGCGACGCACAVAALLEIIAAIH